MKIEGKDYQVNDGDVIHFNLMSNFKMFYFK